MILLKWCRTVLVAAGFVWVMVAWSQYVEVATQEQRRIGQLIDRFCASAAPTDPDSCEMNVRLEGLGGGAVRVTGKIELGGEVDLRQ